MGMQNKSFDRAQREYDGMEPPDIDEPKSFPCLKFPQRETTQEKCDLCRKKCHMSGIATERVDR